MTKAPTPIRARNLAQKHLDALAAGRPITWGTARLVLDGAEFIMASQATGRHVLARVGTDLDRLAAHWRGFTETAAARAGGAA